MHRQYLTMGTFLQISVYDSDIHRAEQGAERAAQAVLSVEHRLSNWIATSELSTFNAALSSATPYAPSATLAADLALAEQCRMATGGYFQPRVGAAAGVALTDTVSTVAVDSGGFGKGLALDQAAEAAGFGPGSRAFLNLGGQVAVYDAAMAVPLAHPDNRGQVMALLRVPAGYSLSVSGRHVADADADIARPTVDHIVNPMTGAMVQRSDGALVRSVSAFWADCLSTAFYAAGTEAAPALDARIRRYAPAYDAALIGTAAGRPAVLWQSAGWTHELGLEP